MNRPMIVALSLTFLTLGGCSKALTESSASGVIQKWIDSQNGGAVRTPAGALTNHIGREMVNAWSAAGVQRLIKQGYLEEKTVAVSYPNFSGQYSGVHHDVNMFHVYVSTPSVDTLDIKTVADTRPPHVEGQFRTCFENNCDVGSVSGAVQRNGPSTLTLSFPERGGSLMSNRPSTRNRLVVALERGRPDAIVGRYTVANSMVNLDPISIRANRAGPNPPDIQQAVYVYSWTNKLPKDTFSGTTLNLGHLVVGSCDHLLLASETTATASCKTQVKLTSGGKAIFGNGPTDQLMQASFGKQPDGTWIGTSINYSAPPFSYVEFDIPQMDADTVVRWRPRESAAAAARSEGKPVLYDFTAAWAGPCHRLNTEGWGDSRTASLVNASYLPVRVVDREREDGKNPASIEELQRRYSVTAFPTLVVADPDGREIAKSQGYSGKENLVRFLEGSRSKKPGG